MAVSPSGGGFRTGPEYGILILIAFGLGLGLGVDLDLDLEVVLIRMYGQVVGDVSSGIG